MEMRNEANGLVALWRRVRVNCKNEAKGPQTDAYGWKCGTKPMVLVGLWCRVRGELQKRSQGAANGRVWIGMRNEANGLVVLWCLVARCVRGNCETKPMVRGGGGGVVLGPAGL